MVKMLAISLAIIVTIGLFGTAFALPTETVEIPTEYDPDKEEPFAGAAIPDSSNSKDTSSNDDDVDRQYSTSTSSSSDAVSCAELERFYEIIDKVVDWHTDSRLSDQDYKDAQQTELDLVEDKDCVEYFAGANFELWEYDN
jgi:hypothetical protein